MFTSSQQSTSQKLNFTNQTNLSENNLKEIIDGLTKNTVKELHLSDTPLTKDQLKSLLAAVKDNKSLTDLDLNHTHNYVETFFQSEKKKSDSEEKKLVEKKSDSSLIQNIGNYFYSFFAKEETSREKWKKNLDNAVKERSKRFNLIEGYTNDTIEVTSYIAEVLKNNSTLKRLKLSKNWEAYIAKEYAAINSIKYLAAGLKVNRGLESLDLSDNNISNYVYDDDKN